jgi:hypothetical protein
MNSKTKVALIAAFIAASASLAQDRRAPTANQTTASSVARNTR